MGVIFDRFIEEVSEDLHLLDLQVGLFWTLSVSEEGAGLCASAHRWGEDRGSGVLIKDAGALIGRRIRELRGHYYAESFPSRAVALSALGSTMHFPQGRRVEERSAQSLVGELLGGKRKCVGMVGHFHFAEELRERGCSLMVFEMSHRCQLGDIPGEEMRLRLRDAEIVIITSSTMVTHSTEEILGYCDSQAKVLLVGPSAFLDDRMFDWGFYALCGSVVDDAVLAKRGISQGGVHKQIGGVRKVIVYRD